MKTVLALIILMLCLTMHTTFSQSIKKTFYTSVYRLNDKKVKGQLVSVNESGIEIKTKKGNEVVPVASIRTIDIRRKGAPAKGMIIGAVAGTLAGVVLGNATNKDTGGYDDTDIVVTAWILSLGQ